MTPANAAQFGAALRADFTPRELQVLSLTVLAEKEIAARLQISPHTVHTYLRSLHCKTGCRKSTELVELWQRWGAAPAC